VQSVRCNILESRGMLVNAVVTGVRQREEGRIDVMIKTSIKFVSSKDTNLRKLLWLSKRYC